MTKANSSIDHKKFVHELFILAISILAILNIFIVFFTNEPDMDYVLVIVNFALSLILLVDFFYRFFTTRKKSATFSITSVG